MSNTIQLKNVWVGHCQDNHSDKIYIILETENGIFESYYGSRLKLNFRQGKHLNGIVACHKLKNEKLNKGYEEINDPSLIKYYCAKALGMNSSDIILSYELNVAPNVKPVEPSVAPAKPPKAKVCSRAKSVSKHLDLHAGDFLTL